MDRNLVTPEWARGEGFRARLLGPEPQQWGWIRPGLPTELLPGDAVALSGF